MMAEETRLERRLDRLVTHAPRPRVPAEGMNIKRTVGSAAGWAAAAANSTDDGRRDEARTPTRPSRGPRYEAARGGCRDRHGVDRDHARGGNTDDRRRPQELSVDRIRALVGRPDGHHGRVRRPCSGD